MFGKRHDPGLGESGEGHRPSGVRVWLGRLGIALLVVVVLAIAAVAWLLHSASRGELTERLLRFGNQLLTSSSNLRVYVGRLRVSGGTVTFQSLQVDAREGGRWYRVLDAKSGDVSAPTSRISRCDARRYSTSVFPLPCSTT